MGRACSLTVFLDLAFQDAAGPLVLINVDNMTNARLGKRMSNVPQRRQRWRIRTVLPRAATLQRHPRDTFPIGLEPITFGSGGRRSIQLSYGNPSASAANRKPTAARCLESASGCTISPVPITIPFSPTNGAIGKG